MQAKYTGIEKNIFADTYNLLVKYSAMRNDEYCWKCLMTDIEIICGKYRGYPLARKMCLNIVEQLESMIGGNLMDGMTYQEWDARLADVKKMPVFNPKTYKDC